jgi:hypothetical protein
MYIFKKLLLLGCSFCFVFNLLSFDEKNKIEVYYFDNKNNGYTLPYEMIINQYQKKCTINNKRISKEIDKILNLIPIGSSRSQCCDIVICRYVKGVKQIIGFDNNKKNLYYQNKSFCYKKRLLKKIKLHLIWFN